MKKYILLLSVVCMFSCNDLFDKTNLESMGSDIVWKDPLLVESYVNNLYAKYPSWSREENDFTDEARNGYRTHKAWNVVKGEWGLESNPMEYWAYSYIRKCNEILQNIDDVTMDEKLKDRMKGETLFFRATAYFKMVIRYGGVPLILEPQTFDSEDLYPKRASVDEIFDFVTKEYEKAAGFLSEFKTQDSNNFGRVTWGACKAMEARAFLFWASPLYNTSQDMSRWENASQLNKEVIDSGLYELKENARDLFLDYQSPENIFAVYYKMPERYNGVDAMCKPLGIANGDAAHWGPLQELVDAFPTINGLDIADDSTYDPTNPYANRDPRLNAFVVVNETQYCGRTQYSYFDLGTIDPSFPKEEADRYKSWEAKGEFQDAAGSAHNSLTSYLCRKVIKEDLPKDGYSYGWGSETPFIEIRLGEVYLNYAEALNEQGNINGACEQLKIIRQRAGILNPEVPAKNKASKEALRKFIQNERYIELCFEQKRYWDLRRWKIATNHLGGQKFSGMKIYLNLLNNSDIISSEQYKKASFTEQLDMLRKSWTYERYTVDEAPYVFDEKMYFMPIPRNDMETNPNLEQNNGW